MRLLEIAVTCCNLNAKERSHCHADSATAYRTLLAIDRRLDEWVADLPPRFAYKRILAKPLERDAFFGEYDVYRNHVAASIWNRYRCIRISACEALLRYESLPTEPVRTNVVQREDVQQRGRRCLVQMSGDICYSVHFYLHCQGGSEACDGDESPGLTMYGGTALVVPLSFAERACPALSDTRTWIRSQIGKITERTGVTPAKIPTDGHEVVDSPN